MGSEVLCPECHHPIRFSDNEAGRCEKIIGPSDGASLCGHLCVYPDEQTRDPWRPIETAPKDDGPSFLVWCPLQKSGNIYHVFRYADDDRFRVYASGGRLLYETPTLWMPLPDPPSNR